MRFPRRALTYGFLLWLIPFAIAVMIFPLKQRGSPLFETVMAVVVVLTATLFVNLYFGRIDARFTREGLLVGLAWMGISLVLDLAMFMWGPMKMSFTAYMADIGLAYVIYPVLAVGTCLLLERRQKAPR